MKFRSKKNKAGKSKPYPIKPSSKKKNYRYHSEKPSWSSRASIRGDMKHMMRKEDSLSHSPREYDMYKRKLNAESDRQFLKQHKKAQKREQKQIKKEEKQQMKQAEEEAKHEYHEDQQTEKRHREEIEDLEGNPKSEV